MGFFDFLSGFFSSNKKTAKKKAASKRSAKSKAKSKGPAIDADQIAEDMKTVRNDAEKKKKKKINKNKEEELKLRKAAAKKKKKKLPTADVGDVIKVTKAKGRKKTKTVTAEPIDTESLGFNIELDKDSEGAKKRKAFRITVDGLKIRCDKLGGLLEATDISASGLGFKFEKPRIKGGVVIKLDIVYQNNIKAEAVKCKVMRHEKGFVGCMFIDMDRHQDDAVHELVVIGQKELADRRRKQKDADWKPPS